jgi:iron complex outermembrane receptor protein
VLAELMWRKPNKALEFAVEAKMAGRIATNDLNQAFSSGYGMLSLRVVDRQEVGGWSITEFARVENVFDHAYVGSVIVNQAASQFYENAPGRNWLGGIRATYKF